MPLRSADGTQDGIAMRSTAASLSRDEGEQAAVSTLRPKAARIEAHRRQGLFPCEAEVARRLSQTPAEWKAKAIVLERDGLPPIDPMMGGRFWPAVQAYWNRRYGLSRVEASALDGQENLDAL